MSHWLKRLIYSSPEIIVSIIVFILYWLVNKSSSGPAYLSDEVAYLTNAALLSGHVIDGASKWHAGYSLFLAPLFLLFEEPEAIWQAVMVLNAFLWALSFFLLARVLRYLVPEIKGKDLVTALVISALYPSWITISGYSFASTGFVFIYLIAILTLFHWRVNTFWSIAPHSLVVGFLYWIHPAGLAVGIASLIAVGFMSVKSKKPVLLAFHLLLLAVMIIIYKFGVHELIDVTASSGAVTVSNIIDPPQSLNIYQNYPGYFRFISNLLTLEGWFKIIIISAGQFSYLLVSSFSIVFYGIIAALLKTYKLVNGSLISDNDTEYYRASILLFLVLSLLGIIGMGALFFSPGYLRIDHWIYGRYSEMVILPLLPLGFLAFWRGIKFKWSLTAVLFLVLTGITLRSVADLERYNNLVNTISFWPQYLITEPNYFLWMVTGAAAIVIIAILFRFGIKGKCLGVIFMISIFIVCAIDARGFHRNILKVYSKPSSFVEIIRGNYSAGTCIGFNPQVINSASLFQLERYYLYLFYFYDYAYRRMSPEDWLESCKGPFFTYNLDELHGLSDLRLIGQEMNSGLYLVVREGDIDSKELNRFSAYEDIYSAVGWSIIHRIIIKGDQLANLPRQVGDYKNSSIYSNQTAGLLVYGPYRQISEGNYSLRVEGEIILNQGEAWIDLVAHQGNLIIDKFLLDRDASIVIIEETINITQDLQDLEIRIWVDEQVEIRIDAIELNQLSI